MLKIARSAKRPFFSRLLFKIDRFFKKYIGFGRKKSIEKTNLADNI
jgi:hypothetical protein